LFLLAGFCCGGPSAFHLYGKAFLDNQVFQALKPDKTRTLVPSRRF